MSRVAVIGGGFGGLTAAAELAHAGHHVTLFERSSTVGGKAQVVTAEGITLDTGPTLLTLPEVVKATFERIGAGDLLPPFHRLALQTRYTWSGGQTFECFEALEPTLTSARAAFGDAEAAGLQAFFAHAARIHRAAGEPYLAAPFEGMPEFLARVLRTAGLRGFLDGMQLGTLAALAERHFQREELRQFVNRFATYAGASPYQASAAFALIPHLERAQGVHHVQGGMGALVAALAQAVRRLGVELRLGQDAQYERRESGLVAGPAGAEEPFAAVVVNADPLLNQAPGAQPLALSGYVALLQVDRRLALAHHHVDFSDDYRTEFAELFSGQVPRAPTVYFCHPVATDAQLAPQGKSGVFAMVNVPAMVSPGDEAAWPETAALLREVCLSTLRRVAGVSRDDVTLLAERTPVDLKRRGAPGGSIYGFLPHGPLAPFQRPRIRSRTPGVFFSGGSTHPGGGVPMVMLSGHFAATYARAHVERR
jgi:1-hydroxycarotenoid 3,4-desaturase